VRVDARIAWFGHETLRPIHYFGICDATKISCHTALSALVFILWRMRQQGATGKGHHA
jgi:hypothetical protein